MYVVTVVVNILLCKLELCLSIDAKLYVITFFQDPIEIVLGEQYVHDQNIEKSSIKVKTHSYQYVSPIKLLEQLLNQVDVFSQVNTKQIESEHLYGQHSSANNFTFFLTVKYSD